MTSTFRNRRIGEGRTAVVLGGTGATGAKVVEELLKREQWTKVVVIGRRPVESDNKKLISYVVDLGKDEIDVTKISGCDHFFNCIGTTRGQAGSADSFYGIEVGITEKVSKACKSAGVKTASVVSARGANPNACCAPKWFHPLFYSKTLGMKEKVMENQEFYRLTCFRPEMLKRGKSDRPMEKYFSWLPNLDVALLAKAMVNDAETDEVDPAARPEPPLVFTGNAIITKVANL